MNLKMKANLLISILILFLLFSCNKENNDSNAFQFQAEVLGNNMDCGIFSIRFISDFDKVKLITGNSSSAIYIAKNLPIELQQSGIMIKLDIRKIQDSELGACKAMGPSYPWLFVTKAAKK
jgi:hypothetical protein